MLLLASGYALLRLPSMGIARTLAWLQLVASTAATDVLTRGEPAGFRMVALIEVGLLAAKGIVAVEAYTRSATLLSGWRWTAFALGWPGMRPEVFAAPRKPDDAGARRLSFRGSIRLAAGVAFLLLSQTIAELSASRWLATPTALVGLSLILHFGVLNLLGALWWRVGICVPPVFRDPLRSCSLSEFWGRRWNLAFSEMTSLAVFRPLIGRIGRRPALAAAFLFSGLLHELAISLPVCAGFGLPLSYFGLHAVAMQIEAGLERRGRPIAGRVGWVWTVGWVVLPLPILFHRSFIEGVVWPLLGWSRAA